MEQTKNIDLPADSIFAVAMRHQQEAEKEEKKRLKDLVLNLDLRDDTDADGIDPLSFLLQPNPNVRIGRPISTGRFILRRDRHHSSEDPVICSLSSSPMPPASATAVPRSPLLSSTSCENENAKAHNSVVQGASIDKSLPNPYTQPRVDRAGKGRSSQRGRQLQVSDLDWYASPNTSNKDISLWNGRNGAESANKENDGVYRGRGYRHIRGRGRRN
jgi:regulator of nonsense transcripts 2